MLRLGLIVLAFAATSALGTWLNVRLPGEMVNILNDIAENLWSLDGLLPIEALFNTIFTVLSFLLFLALFKLVWSVLGGGNDLD